ncbi:hypothetical protein [uncultured Rikenella sp.]|nr:hypothetical protein [uncultured Rikenella sp.]
MGNHGACWSSTVSLHYGQYMDFNTFFLYTSRALNRSHGIPLRCLPE